MRLAIEIHSKLTFLLIMNKKTSLILLIQLNHCTAKISNSGE